MVCEQQNYILENKMHKILWDFKIQMNHPILVRSGVKKKIGICHQIITQIVLSIIKD